MRCFYQVWLYFDSWRFFVILVLVAEKKSERKERKEKKKEAKNVRMIHFPSTSCWFLKPQKTEEVACVAGPRKNGRARGRHARGEGGPARKAHENRSTSILWVWTFPIGREAPEGKINRTGRENCQSIVHGQRSEGLILRHQLLKPLNGIIRGAEESPRKSVVQSACQYDVTSRVSNFQNGEQSFNRRVG